METQGRPGVWAGVPVPKTTLPLNENRQQQETQASLTGGATADRVAQGMLHECAEARL